MDWEGAQLLKAHIYIFIFLLHQVVCSASPTNAPFSHNIVRMKGTTSGGAEAGCQKSWQTAWIDSFCSTRLSSATQFAPSSVSLQHLSVLIEVMDPILTFHFLLFFSPLFFVFFPPYSPAAAYKTGFLINSASWVSNCHLPVMKINVACLIWAGRQVFFSRSRTRQGRVRPSRNNTSARQNANLTAGLFLRNVTRNVTSNFFFFFLRIRNSVCKYIVTPL